MNKRFYILTWVALGIAGSLPSPAAAATRMAILSDEKSQAAADVLVAELSANQPQIELVERAEIDRVRREHALGAQGSAETSLQLAGLLRADGLLALETVTVENKPVLSARLVAAGPAVILGAAEWAVPVPPDPAGQAKAVAAWMQPLTPKLMLPPGEAVPLSLLNLRAPLKVAAAAALEGPLTFLLSRQLIRQPKLLVLERWRLGDAATEKEFTPADEKTSAFWRGSYVVDGEIIPAPTGNETIPTPSRFHVKLYMRSPGGGGAGVRTLEADGTADILADVAADLAARVANEVGGDPSQLAAWQPRAEAAQYLNEALWAAHADLPLLAGPATEAAWALGNRDPALYRLRVLAHSALAFPPTEGMDQSPMAGGYRTDTIDVRGDNGSHLRHALLALNAFDEFLIQPFAAKPPRRIDCRSTLGSTALLAAARVLRNYYDRGLSTPNSGSGEDLADLRAACRRTLAELLPLMEPDKELLGTWGPDLIEAIYLPYWSERPEDACAAYPCVLHREIPTRQRGNRYFANYSLLVRRFDPGSAGSKAVYLSTDARSTPFLIGWHGEAAEDLAARWETFLHRLETNPARPTDPLDAAFLRFADAITWQDKAARLAVLKKLLWDARDAVLTEERIHAYVDGIDNLLAQYEYERRLFDASIETNEGRKREPRLSFGREEIHRWVSYYLEHAEHDDYEFMLGLGLIDPFTADEAAEFYRSWTAMKARLDARADGWRTKTPAATYSTIESRWLGRFPTLAPPTPPGALAIKKLWLLPGLAETVAHDGFFEDGDVAWCDGLLWVRAAFTNAGEDAGSIYAVRLPECQVVERIAPPQGVKLSRFGGTIRMGAYPGRFQVSASAIWMLGGDAVGRYDRKTKVWTEVALPPGFLYTALQPDDANGGFYVGYSGNHGGDSGILHWIAQGGGRFDVLSSSRRRPRQNALDDRPDYGVYDLFPGPGQSLGADVDLMGRFYDLRKGDWYDNLPWCPTSIWLTKTAARTLFFWHGFLARIENAEPGRPLHWLWNEAPVAGVKPQSERLAGDPGGVASSHYMDLEPFIASGSDGSLWVTAPRDLSAGREQVLHRYDWTNEKAREVAVPLDFQISEADRALVTSATRHIHFGPEEPSSRLRLLATEAGLVFWDFGLPGFWILPTSEIKLTPPEKH